MCFLRVGARLFLPSPGERGLPKEVSPGCSLGLKGPSLQRIPCSRWGSECRSIARRSLPSLTSWASEQRRGTRLLCPARSSKYPRLPPSLPCLLPGPHLGSKPAVLRPRPKLQRPNPKLFHCPRSFLNPVPPQLSFLPPPWGDCSSASMDPDFEDPSDPLGAPSPSSKPSPPYSLMGCRMACETRYVARKCGCRMMHMPGKELGTRGGRSPAGRCGARDPASVSSSHSRQRARV